MGALNRATQDGYLTARLWTIELRLVIAAEAGLCATILPASAGIVLPLGRAAAAGLLPAISVARLVSETPAGTVAGNAIKCAEAAETAFANCAFVAAVDPDGTGLKSVSPPGRKLLTKASSLKVAP